ncbi:MAG: hypothetical protein IH795_07725 [Bacteroidetes bacterium]|nr:hypothetical protein [Bacteroidota bacterium]
MVELTCSECEIFGLSLFKQLPFKEKGLVFFQHFFQKNIEINSNTIRFSSDKNLKALVNVVTDKKTKKKYIHVAYEGRNEFIKDIKFLLEFDHKVELGGSGGE